jgi:hypothetical protein
VAEDLEERMEHLLAFDSVQPMIFHRCKLDHAHRCTVIINEISHYKHIYDVLLSIKQFDVSIGCPG